jgi:hypothetical protein
MSPKTPRGRAANHNQTARRKKYRKPRILSEEKLEVVAALCSPGKTPDDPPFTACGTNQFS